jgi:hypothetical protein
VRRIEQQVAHEVSAEVDFRPRNVVVLEPGMIPRTTSGKLERACASASELDAAQVIRDRESIAFRLGHCVRGLSIRRSGLVRRA